jgi:hypothetical protein
VSSDICSNLETKNFQGRSALSKPADRKPTPVSVLSVSISSAPVVVTASSVPSASKPVTSHGLLKVSLEKSVSSLSHTILPITSSSEPTPLPSPPLSKLMPLLSDNGMRHTTVRTWAEDVNRRLAEKSPSQRRRARV